MALELRVHVYCTAALSLLQLEHFKRTECSKRGSCFEELHWWELENDYVSLLNDGMAEALKTKYNEI